MHLNFEIAFIAQTSQKVRKIVTEIVVYKKFGKYDVGMTFQAVFFTIVAIP